MSRKRSTSGLEAAPGRRAGGTGRRRRSRSGPAPGAARPSPRWPRARRGAAARAGRGPRAGRARAGERARRGVRVGRRGDVEAGPVGRDRLEPHEAVARAPPRPRRARARAGREAEPGGDALLPHALDPHHRRRPAAGELAHPRASPRPRPARGKPSSIEQPLGAGRAQQRRRVLVGVGVARRWAKTASSVGSQPSSAASAAIARRYVSAGRDVRPLARVVALGEQPAELVERRRGSRRSRARGGRRARPRSVLLEVPLLLECLVLRRVGLPLRAAHREVGAGEHRAERAGEHVVGRRARRAPPPASRAAGGSPRASRSSSLSVAGSTSTGSGGSSPRSIPSRPAAISAAEREVRVAASRREAFSSSVGRRLLHAAEQRRHPQRRLAVVVAPAGERARPVLRDDPVVGVEARRGQRRTGPGRWASTPARNARPSAPRAVGRAGVVEAVAARRVPEREVDVAAVAGAVGPRLRRERRDEPVLGGDAADRLAHEQLLVGRLAAPGAWAVEISCWPWPSSA